MTNTISTTVNSTVLINSGNYSITSSGGVIGTTGAIPAANNTNGNPGSAGVQISAGVLTNTGHIYGGTGSKDHVTNGYGFPGTGGVGVSETSGVVINTGSIIGGAGGYGDSVTPGSAQHGGNGGYGVVISGGTFINDGFISGGAGAQVAGYGHQHYAATSGTSGNGVTISNGVFVDNGSIYDTGVELRASNATIIMESGATSLYNFVGDGASTLEAGGTTPFILSGIGASGKLTGFGHLAFGSTLGGFGLSGTTLGLTNGQIISGFVSGDTITVTGFAATSESFASSTALVLRNSGGTTETLDLTGLTSAEALILTSNGTNSTISAVAAVTTISAAVAPGVTLETGHYSNLLTVTSTGTVIGGAAGGFTSLPGGTGLTAPVTATLINQGKIIGGLGGLGNEVTGHGQNGPTGGTGGTGISLVGGSFNNSGQVTGGLGGKGGYSLYGYAGLGGTGGVGLTISGAETVTNSGTIRGGQGGQGGDTDFGSRGTGGAGGAGVSASGGIIINTGLITTGSGGQGGGAFNGSGYGRTGIGGDGVYLSGSTLINYGIITGGYAAVAVQFGAAAATLVIENGAVFNGAVVANAAVADVLAFVGAGASKWTGIGTAEQNFKQISFAAGAAWTIEGNVTGLATGESITGFTSADHLILDGFAATSETLNGGVLTLASGATTHTLSLGAATDNFVAISDGNTTTIGITPASISLGTGDFVIAGHSAGLSGAITGFGFGDTINLDGFAATSETFEAGIGLVLSNGSSTDTIALNSLTGGFFAEHTDGTNTTITAAPLISIISTNLPSSARVNLGGGTYAANLTITSSGVLGSSFGPGEVYAGSGVAVSLTNQGVIDGSSENRDGVSLQAAGYIKNTGLIRGTDGIYLAAGGTVYNAGSIDGTDGIVAKGALTLIETPGALFGNGRVFADAGGTLILAAGAPGQIGNAYVRSFYGFSNISFASGSSWEVSTRDNLNLTGVSLNGFAAGDTIDLEGFAAQSKTFAAGQLVLNGTYTGGFAQSVTLDISGDFTTADFSLVSDGSGGTDILPCFLSGTHISTPRGEVAVEDLSVGDLVLTSCGRPVPIRWIGVRKVATRFVNSMRAFPIRIQAGALADGVPARDLLVSPDHAMFLGGILVQAGALVNGISITREASMPASFTYYHVEVVDHALILAEGAPTETFVDNADRKNFDNWAEHEALHGNALAIAELPYPRAKSARQLPVPLRHWLDGRAQVFGKYSKHA